MGFGGLYTSISGLRASRKSLDTVAHNMANANNRNYVRQSAIHANNNYNNVGGVNMQVGTGVNIQEVRQIRDDFLDAKIRRESADFGFHSAKSQILGDIEGIFNEISDSGLQNVMDDFWFSWNELAKDPSELTIRALVHESAVAFTTTTSHISKQLNDIQQNLNKEITNKVNEINVILDRVAGYNKRIKVVEGSESKIKANDFRDERNSLLDRLAVLLPVKYYENTYGETTVSLFGQDLVSSDATRHVELHNDNNGLGHIYYQGSNEKIELGKMGELGGFISVRDESVVEYGERLDILVRKIAKGINELHKSGTDLEDEKGGDFFVGLGDNISAFNIKVNPDLADYNKIAASLSGSKGDGEIAQAIFDLRDEAIFKEYGSDMNADDYYRDLTLALGLERNASRSVEENQGFLIRNIDQRRKSISGVSLEEEMANMVKFQHSYAANSRVINAIDEMIDRIVNRM